MSLELATQRLERSNTAACSRIHNDGGVGFALFDAIQAINEQSIERGITALRETLSAFYLPYALADLYISSVYDAYVRLNNGTATYSDIMMLTTGYPTSAVYTGSYQYYYQLQQYNQHLNNP